MGEKILVFDSTLRDGAQAEGISFSVEDKIRVMETLDRMGVDYIEAGNPGSNPKDIEFFNRIKNAKLKHAKLVAFGSTRRGGIHVEDDANLAAILDTQTPAVAIFGKSWTFHITDIIKTTLDENLKMIQDTMAYLKAHGKDVTFDAEHFFDGYKADPAYAIDALLAAQEGGADYLALCDTNGGTLPSEIFKIVTDVKSKLSIPLGIHCHNDSGLAVANSLMAVEAGVRQVQGTFLGYGERSGNANLSTIIPNLQLKMGYECLSEAEMQKLTSSAIRIAEISNFTLSNQMPFVGKSSFAHKGGMHIDAVMKNPASFEHVPPESVGNERRILMSEVSGRSTIIQLINEVDPTLTKKSEETTQVMDRIKELEYQGYQFEGAESSVKLLIRKELGKHKPFFTLEDFKTIGEKPHSDESLSSSAVVKINVDGQSEINAAEGDGPVNALDKALRKALEVFYPTIKNVRLTDFKVRVIDSKSATAAKVRVLIESSDGQDIWTSVGVSTDVIEASLIALTDSIEYKLLCDEEKK
ncbi:MAG: citramalate synthase [Eubacteriaceae bacterium]|jgi:2-isopropylmalate synthase|nr:2-isopropylmalate synthase [Eubacteriaceae bacterium]